MASIHILKLYKCNKNQEFREYDLSVIMAGVWNLGFMIWNLFMIYDLGFPLGISLVFPKLLIFVTLV